MGTARFGFALLALTACSSGDDSSAPPPAPTTFDAGANPGKSEAGAPCVTANDCAPGLACVYPATTCDAFKVCAPPAVDPCPQAQTVCSCLGATITACGGFADEPIDHDGACGDGGSIVPEAGGSDAPVDQGAPPMDSGSDTGGADAADAATE